MQAGGQTAVGLLAENEHLNSMNAMNAEDREEKEVRRFVFYHTAVKVKWLVAECDS